MILFIRIKDEQPFGNPIFEKNFYEAFPNVDVNNLPAEFARFERVARPLLGIYEVMVSDVATYELIDGVYKDVWHKRDLTEIEKASKQQTARDTFNAREHSSNWSAWTLDDATCTMVPPITRPSIDETKISQNIFTFWCGAVNNWKDSPATPEVNYKFDFFAVTWVSV